MATGTIPAQYIPRAVGSTGNTGSVTFQMPDMTRRGAFVVFGTAALYMHCNSGTPGDMVLDKLHTYSGTPTITSNGDWNYTISGLPWYTEIFVINGFV